MRLGKSSLMPRMHMAWQEIARGLTRGNRRENEMVVVTSDLGRQLFEIPSPQGNK